MDVIVRASDDPHGVVEFTQPSAVVTPETGLTLSVPIERLKGLVGDLVLNFIILQSSTASSPEDFILLNHSECFCTNQSDFILIIANMCFNNKSVTASFMK